MITISEVLPNPVGADKGGEYIVLFNNSTQPVSLAGWKLRDASGKTARLDGYTIAAASTLKLTDGQTGITLNNSVETLSLLGPSGATEDTFSYNSPAAQGMPLLQGGALTPQIRQQLFDELAQANVALPVQSMGSQAVLFAALLAVILAGIAVYVLKHIQPYGPQTNS